MRILCKFFVVGRLDGLLIGSLIKLDDEKGIPFQLWNHFESTLVRMFFSFQKHTKKNDQLD